MKVSLIQKNLDIGLSICSRVVQATSSLPILSNVLLITKKGELEIQATNLETSIRYSLPVKIESAGECSVPAKLLSDIIHSLKDDKIQITKEKDNITIRSDGFNSVINGMNAADFPKIPDIETKNTITLKTQEFVESLEEVLVAVSLDESRPVLAGVLFSLEDSNLKLVSTDSYRLVENVIKVSEKANISVIIPARALLEVIRIANLESEGTITISTTDTEIVFNIGNAQIISQLIEGEYPDYKKIIPSNTSTNIVINKEELVRTIKIASLFSRENAHSIELEIAPRKLKINSNTTEVGSNSSELVTKVSGTPITINLNARYLLDAASSIKSETLNLGFSGKLDPCVVRAEGKYHSEYIHIIMPLRS